MTGVEEARVSFICPNGSIAFLSEETYVSYWLIGWGIYREASVTWEFRL
jgi:hypothetical protein